MPSTAGADVVVVGGGVAGLATALGLEGRRVRLLTPRGLGRGGASVLAQGGVAAAVGEGDSPALHAADTLAVAGGIADPEAVAALTAEGPAAISRLIAAGAAFDRDAGGGLALGREAAHSRRRIVHAGGDATGAELMRALSAAVAAAPWITVEEATVTDLLLDDGRVVGVVGEAASAPGKVAPRVWAAGAVVLATGGPGHLWLHTTNPPESTGAGLALAARAGAVLADLEFVQFHPTALLVDEDPHPLLTEALRGEGALLVDESGRRLLAGHPQGELAPRDVIARALWQARREGHQTFLDARAIGAAFPQRFPTVFARCRAHGLDPRLDLLPVTPAAHYHMGGIATDLNGRSSLPGLWACGEVASTGVHGANRLASNSLLEGLVFGQRVAADVAAAAPARPHPWRALGIARRQPRPAETAPPDAAWRRRLRAAMWDEVGLLRSAAGLAAAARELDRLAEHRAAAGTAGRDLLTAARAITAAALLRPESRGAHTRADAPAENDAWRTRSAWTLPELDAALAAAALAAGRPARRRAQASR